MRLLVLVIVVILLLAFGIDSVGAISCVFRNPLLAQGQDPSVVFKDGAYYLVQSGAAGLTVAKSTTITGLASAEPVIVYKPPTGQPYSYDLWAPELAYLHGDWYIYVAATSAAGDNATHRMYALKADTQDPQGAWTMMNKVFDPAADKWAIDAVVFEFNDVIYMVWSGWPGDVGDFPQNLYIATMSDPLTLSSPRHLISEPDQVWERSVAAINEGPEAFIHNGSLSIVYSANASWTTAYNLGMLHLTGSDPLDRASWTKSGSAFARNGDVYGPGHNSMPVPSPDGSESWLIYHAKTQATDGWADRAIFAQSFTWNADGTPNFGQPIPSTEPVTLPAGEPCGEVTVDPAALQASANGEIQLDGTFVDTGSALIRTLGSFSVVASVNLTNLDQPMAILSQEGGISSNFVLQFADGNFQFTMFDGMGRSSASAISTTTPQTGVFYQLVGVHDLASHQVQLYVNGKLEGSAEFTADWDARGHTMIGVARHGSKRVDLFSGLLRDIHFYSGALDADEIAAIQTQ